MHAFWEMLVSNALVVTALAMVVALLGRIWKNPEALHLLWLLVLVKFITPPLIILPVPWTVNLRLHTSERLEVRQGSTERSPVQVFRKEETAFAGPIKLHHQLPDEGSVSRTAAPIDDVVPSVAEKQGKSWLMILTGSWVVGIALFALGQAFRILRLRRLLCDAVPASPAILRITEEIGQRLGLRRLPEVLMVSVRLSPMVWSPGLRPRLVLPAELFARLHVPAQEVIVTHELAHIHRRDHWARLLELSITTLFWWHPVAWWACRRLRDLEEQCCDGLVLKTVPHGGRAYATALVDTLDFLSERSLTLPPVSTGASSVVSLSRRITMLTNQTPVRPLTAGPLLLLLAVAAIPMAVAFAAGTYPKDDRPTSRDQVPISQSDNRDSLLAQKSENQGTNQPAPAKPAGTENSAEDKKAMNNLPETWRLDMSLHTPNMATPAVQWAIFDRDPLPVFKARIQKYQSIYQEQMRRADNKAAKEEARKAVMTLWWDQQFMNIPGYRLYLLTSDHPGKMESSVPVGKKWIVTKVVQLKGKPVCWSSPVEFKVGKEVKVAMTEENKTDLESVLDGALRETGALAEKGKEMEDWFRKTWRMGLRLRVPGPEPFAVLWTILDEDPVPGFKTRVKEMQTLSQEQDKRQAEMIATWDAGFRAIHGDRLYEESSTTGAVMFSVVSSNGRDGKKWVVTRVAQLQGKPVCWCLPVEVKIGKEIRVILTEKNVFDLESTFASALRETGTSAKKSKETGKSKRKSWQVVLNLQVPDLVPTTAPWAIFDKDPVLGYKASVKRMQTLYRDRLGRAIDAAEKEQGHNAGMEASWNSNFKDIPGDCVSLLTPGSPYTFISTEPDGNKWIATKVVRISKENKFKLACWCIPVDVKSGKEIKVTLTEDNMFDLGPSFDSVLQESGPPK